MGGKAELPIEDGLEDYGACCEDNVSFRGLINKATKKPAK